MIQRVQTIFLFLIALAMVAALTNPIWEKMGAVPTEMAHLTAIQYTYQQGITSYVDNVWYLALLIGLVGLSSVYAIFQYRNRLTQSAFCAVNALMLTAIMGITLYRTLYMGKQYGNPGDQGTFRAGFYALIAALVFNALANRFIRRDEKLVRGSDRLR